MPRNNMIQDTIIIHSIMIHDPSPSSWSCWLHRLMDVCKSPSQHNSMLSVFMDDICGESEVSVSSLVSLVSLGVVHHLVARFHDSIRSPLFIPLLVQCQITCCTSLPLLPLLLFLLLLLQMISIQLAQS